MRLLNRVAKILSSCATSGLPVTHSLKPAYNRGMRGGPRGAPQMGHKSLSRDTLNALLKRD